ncbi:MAG: hypothetical protein HFI34_00855 [Lachnospiraceae bacterium]|nr:hypothetical protein [Lachnospiraceae bacterium]
MNKVLKEILKGMNLEENLPVYGKYLADLYNRSAAVELALDYYTYYEMLEDRGKKDENLQRYAAVISEIIEHVIIPKQTEAERNKAITEIDGIRNEIYQKVDGLAAYADIFSRYEYVSNRCEYLFKDTDLGGNYSDEEFTRQIMQYIFSEEDNTVINGKISEIIAEVPLRMTKSKFFQLLSEGMTVYNQTDRKTVDDFVYVLKSSSMLILPEQIKDFQDLHEIYLYAKNMNYDTITESQFCELEQKLKYAAAFIDDETGLYMMLQGIVNKIYAMLNCMPYVSYEQENVACCIRVLQAVNEAFQGGEYKTLSDEVTESFGALEGVPEELYSKISSVEYGLDTVKEQYMKTVSDIKVEEFFRDLFITRYLMSDSLFVDLSVVRDSLKQTDVESESFDIKVYVEQKRQELEEDLTRFFHENQKIVNRSVMALILSRLPVFFNNITEIQDYIFYSVSNCTNKAEKAAVVEIIKCIINEI